MTAATRSIPDPASVARFAARLRGVCVPLLALPWAGSLVVGGLWLLLVLAPRFDSVRTVAATAGITALAAGHLVFFVLVADRLFPDAGRRLGRRVELAASLSVVAGVAAVSGILLAGGAADALDRIEPAREASPILAVVGVRA